MDWTGANRCVHLYLTRFYLDYRIYMYSTERH